MNDANRVDVDHFTDLVEVFGGEFLAYVLNREEPVTQPPPSDLSPGQVAVLGLLASLRQPYRPEAGTPEGAVWASRLNIDRYLPELESSLANVLRRQSGGAVPEVPVTSDPVLQPLYQMLVECYPALLLPEERPGPPVSVVTFNHPARPALEAAILADPILARLYTEESENTGWSGSVFRSTGQGGGVQLWTFASQQLTIAHAWASLDTDVPTLSDVAEKLELSVRTIRRAVEGKDATVPVRVGLTGVLLPDENEQVDLGWAKLRRPTEPDRRIAERTGLSGKLQTTRSDGGVVAIDFAGDVIAMLEVPYKIRLGEVKLEMGWPPELMAMQLGVGEDIESLRLGLALALAEDQPALVVQSWQLTIDPLASAALPGWNDTRRTPNLLPRQLTDDQTEIWATWAKRVKAYRAPSMAVAVRRMLQSLGERNNPEDVLVDAVIVWENLFGASQETTLRISTALAWLLGTDAADRAERQKLYKNLYALRSKIVHGAANVPTDKLPTSSREAVDISLAALRELFESRPELLAERSSEERGNRLILGS